MKGPKALPFVGLGVVVLCALLMSACGGKTPSNGPSPLNIQSSNPLPTGAEGDAYKIGLFATGGTQPYTWTIDSGALPPGITLTADGVVSGTPPPGSAGTYSFTIRVTDSQSPVKAFQIASESLTINPPLSFPAATLQNGVIAVAYSAAVVASGGINCIPPMTSPCYTYALAPGSASLPAGLTLNADGTITGTPTGPIGTTSFTVQVTDQFPTTATANFSITVTGKIQGNYAFSFNGYNSQGQAFYMAGSFMADGNGNITSGVFDRNGNDSIGAMTDIPITPGTGANGQCPFPSGTTGSVYCVGRSGVTNGNNLGTIVIAWTQGGQPQSLSFSIAVSIVSDSRILLADPNNPGMWGSGVVKVQGQTLSGISLASTSFAFGLFGIDSAEHRYGGAGFFQTDATGTISAGNGGADINDNGALQSQASLTGNVSAFDPATGRGTATFTVGGATLDYAFYVIAPSTGKLFPSLLAVQTDAVSGDVPVTLASITARGPANSGTSTFTNLSLKAIRGMSPNGDLFELNAVSTAGGAAAPDISLGLGNFDGAGNISAYTFDENSGGTLTTQAQNNYTGTYLVDQNNKSSGRVAVTLNGVTNNPVWYLSGINTGYVVGTDANVTVGSFEPQTVQQPIGILSLFGNFYGGTDSPVLPSVINEVEADLASPPPPPGTGNGTFAMTYDSNGPGSGMPQMNQMFSGFFCIADGNACPNPQQASSATGRILITTDSGGTTPADILYLVSGGASGVTSAGTKSVILSTGANPSLTVVVH